MPIGKMRRFLLIGSMTSACLVVASITAMAESAGDDWAIVTNRPECKFLNVPPPFPHTTQWSGQCTNGFVHGKGTVTYGQGVFSTRMSGTFQKGVLNGQGEFIHWLEKRGSFVKTVYQGQFKNSMIQGHGTLILDNLAVFTGEFHEGKLKGPGVIELPNLMKITANFSGGSELFTIVAEGVMEKFGEGAYRYTGSFNGIIKEGQGVLELSSGSKYEGSFLDDQYHGHGAFTQANGDVCTGNWEKGLLIGIGIGTKDGKQTRCAMDKNGAFVFDPLN